MRSFRAILVAAILTVGAMNSTGPSHAQDLPAVRIAALATDQAAEPFYAQEQGFFAKQGLKASVSVFTSGPAIAAAVIGGSFDIGVANVPTLAAAYEKGVPVSIVAPGGLYLSKAPNDVCAVAKSSPITSATQLNGKTFGVVGLHNIGELGALAWLDKGGADLNTVKFVELPFSAVGPALAQGRIDAGVLVDPALQTALNAGQARVLSKCFDAIAPEFVVVAFFARTDYAKAHRDVIEKFAAAMSETARWANAHPQQSAQILTTWAKVPLPPNTVRAQYPESLIESQFQPVLDAAAKYHLLKSTLPAQNLFAPGVAASG
jgi:NitT/TauT family transport system substrate-binding protein